ncbi:MAG: hypothetical protein AB7I36_08470 [Rhodospirillaceae bacterium]
MKALSLWQPWASLWVSGVKVHETRHWPLKVAERGFWLAVHAAQRFEKNVDPELSDILCDTFGGHWSRDLTRGAIVGKVFIGACVRSDDLLWADDADFTCGNWTPGRFGFRADRFAALKAPIPYRGQQGMFQVPDALLADDSLFTSIENRRRMPSDPPV